MEEVCERENCKQALARVKANKGSAGMDGMTVQELPEFLKQHWPAIREQVKRQFVCKQQTIERRDENSNDTPWFGLHTLNSDKLTFRLPSPPWLASCA